MSENRAYRLKVIGTDDAKRTFTAIVSTFNVVDSYGERMMPGCYSGSLAKQMPVGVASHDWTKPVFTTVCKEVLPGDPELDGDDIDPITKEHGGLWVQGAFFETKDAEETYILIRDGGFREFSVGYTTIRDGWGDDGIREIYEVELHEVSPVLVGANPNTQVISIKRNANFDDHIVTLDNEVTWLVDRLGKRCETRLKEGRVLSSRNVALLETLAGTLKEAHTEIKRLLSQSTPAPKAITDDAKGRTLTAAQLKTILNSTLKDHTL
jgi:HK97 family phage prohead protease